MADVAVKQTECSKMMSSDNKDNCNRMADCMSEMRQLAETALAGQKHMFDQMFGHIPPPTPAKKPKKAKRSHSDEDDSDECRSVEDDPDELKPAARKKYKS